MWCIFHTHKQIFLKISSALCLISFLIFLSSPPLWFVSLSSIFHWLTPFILSFPKSIKRAGCKGASGLIAVLRCLLLWCECRSERARELVCVHTHISLLPSYCKFSSKLLRASEGLLSAKKCHINSHTRTHTHWMSMVESTASTIYIKCRDWLMVVTVHTHAERHTYCTAPVCCNTAMYKIRLYWSQEGKFNCCSCARKRQKGWWR